MFIYQDNGSIVYTNKTFNEFLGYDHNELLGKSFYDLIDVPDKELEMIKNIAKRRMQGEVFSIELKEYVLIGKNKIKVPVSIFAYTIEYEGKPSGLVVVFNKTKEKAYEKLFFALSQINQLIIRQNDCSRCRNRWQFDTLKSMGCDYFQGYLFYKPMPKDKFFELLKNGG
ncbi:PAS domain-containing protein [Desulfurella multipotens]|uniref:PAS domain-containing protein n=1 Tax=Desulfurella multipotens TaxID=79269 RepID=UPI00248003FF|nr:PAS domain-containing protein [Desulfurella multipotens]